MHDDALPLLLGATVGAVLGPSAEGFDGYLGAMLTPSTEGLDQSQ